MAQKRMFDKSITNSDNFLELPDSSQILYFHLSMNADDDGFIDNWKSIMRMTGTKEDDLKILITKSYVIPFDTGVIVIRHWRMNNYLRTDRYKETTHKRERNQLILGENEEYLLQKNGVGIPMVNPDKNSIDKNRLDYKEKNIKKEKFVKPTLEEVEEYCKERNSSVDAKTFYEYFETGGWKDSKGNKVKNWKQKLITWESHKKPLQKENIPNWFNEEQNIQETTQEDKKVLDDILEGIGL